MIMEDGQYKALVMEFDLPSSCYATMVLREILKVDTSSSAQARLNDYHESEKKKIVVSQTNENDKTPEMCGIMQTSSLLLDPNKYAEFKDSVFKVSENSVKRKNDEEKDDNKKVKTDESVEETGIKMEASLV
ncbi:hypothetical protein NQ314_003351 [Rhamnusium bicolor]|uniref:Uncharacterized protein n=1 Tax=Rhamnusium bicolor TaxID=1586634 RepID=A0AAV8ZP60_9CUCU|nr:hypothetical protein NQ314_003351 [Rhamnusium bicolor]